MRRREEAASLGCSAITLDHWGHDPAVWLTHPMASPGGPSLELTDHDRILAPARGARSVTKAPRCRERPCRTSHP